MAYFVKLSGISKEPKKSGWEIEPTWWSPDIFIKDKRFKENHSDGYIDYDADFTPEETRAIHEKYRPSASKGIYSYQEWQAIIQPLIKEMDEVLYSKDNTFEKFHIQVLEWESGL